MVSATKRAVTLAALLAVACGGSDGSGTPPAPDGGTTATRDGSWNLQVHVDTCFDFTHASVVTIAGGAFDATLFTYCAIAKNGATRLATAAGCGADITETVRVTGAVSGNSVEGNVFLSGGACNGGNGYSGTFSSATAGSGASAWGTLVFSKN